METSITSSAKMEELKSIARGKAILAEEAAAISAVELTVSFDESINALYTCHGKIVTTGMGKAGFIARKFAATLCSTGTPAVYLHPGEAAHGDLGIIGKNDCIFAFSTSGKTREILELIELARRLECGQIICVTSHSDSPLRLASDITIDMGIITEPCVLGLTPSASIAVMSSISDALVLVLMEKKGVTRQDYGLRHHGGYLGEKARTISREPK